MPGDIRSKGPRPATLEGETTGAKLVQAAADEFNERGFFSTDSNRIARRAGFAPQTFYRWFSDKTDIFIAVYERWEQLEREAVRGLISKRAPDDDLVELVLDHHRNYLLFRRSLRRLAVENNAVRAARAASRLRQIQQIKAWAADPVADDGAMAAALLQIERLADAVVEGEFADLGFGEESARHVLAKIIHSLRPTTPLTD
jgi:AcrR family transcriptional regulator